ncbi:MAG TPA: HAD hydrolase-like protein [Acidimicrobiales bacterium]|nr:HAD hydrolase-like protein [Acidimicrobiales bacterium]
MANKTFVLFDLDGTLTDSGSGIVASYRHALASLGLSATDDQLRRCVGPPISANMVELGVPFDLVDQAIASYREYFTAQGMFDNALYPQTREMLEQLSRAGIRLGVATSKLEEYARQIIEHFGIAQFFEEVSGATRDNTRVSKLDIAVHALVNMGSPPPAQGALVGDREHDMFAACELDLAAVGAMWGYGDKAELLAAGAQLLVDSPQAAAEALLAGRP